MRMALNLNRVHGGGMMPWLCGLSPFALAELHRHTTTWLDDMKPDDGDE